ELTDKLSRNDWDAQTADLRAKARTLHNELARLPELLDQCSHLREEVSKLEGDVCAMCDRQWDNAKEKLADVVAKVVEVEEAIEVIRGHRPEAERLDTEIASRVYKPDNRLGRFQVAKNTITAQIAEAVAETEKFKAVAMAEKVGRVTLAQSEAQSARAK